jgi:signal transduction histidine kinase
MVDGNLVYAGEPDGVYVYQKGFRHRKKAYELPLATEIRKDSLSGMWIKNVHGETIGKYPGKPHSLIADLPQYLTAPIKLRNITAQYSDGNHVWIGGDEKLTIIDLSQKDLAKLSDCHTIRFRSIILDNDSVLWGGYGNMPEEPFQLADNERHLRFFYALDFVPLSGQVYYRYRLNDNKWSSWSKNRSVEFLNQPYGSYTLSVQAKLASGELSDVTSVRFRIAYPLPLRWYMIVLYILGLVYLVFLLFRYRLTKLKKDKIKLEQIVEERTADLRKAQHELIRQEKMSSVVKLTAGLIDRILNPMNYIINFSKMSNDLLKDLKANFDHNKDKMDRDDYDDSEDIIGMLTQNLQDIDRYGQNTTRTLKSMEEMLKDRTGGYIDMDLLPILKQSEEMFNHNYAKEIARFGILAVFNFPDKAMPLNGNPEMLCKTIMDMLGNAVYAIVKKAAPEPMIQFTATEADGQYILKIRDNGIGIDQDLLDKIFDPFFTTKTTGEASGVGLYLSREIIQNHGGDISVASAMDQFTEFTITLPASQQLFSDFG